MSKFKTIEEAVAHIATQDEAIKGLNAQTAELEKAVTEALAEVATLSAKLDLQEKHGSEGVIVSIGKKSFRLEGDSFVYGGGIKTAQELSKDSAQLKKMLESESGSLIPLD